MSYAGISVREALEKLNAHNSGWYLPEVQRQYVWGARHGSEEYVCLLLDSLLKRYPIGGVVLWETSELVPYREFVREYAPGQFAHLVDKGRWGAAKSLVYDGQQRLQTLYSVLHHRFNGRVLYFDLLFDAESAESDETGFLFRGGSDKPDPRYLRMTELVSTGCTQREKVALEKRVLVVAGSDEGQELLIRENLTALWDVFVETNLKSIAYFSVRARTPKEVNEVFRRLNTGGVALTQIELVLGKIKAVHSNYEEELWALSDQIAAKTGIEFSSADILQFLYLLVKRTIRIDGDRVEAEDIVAFEEALREDVGPLVETFQGYLNGTLNINHASIVPRWRAVLPIAAYLTARKRGNREWRIRALPEAEVSPIDQYFILSQFCDWNTQTMVNQFANLAMGAAESGEPFPVEVLRQVAIEKNRTGILHEYQFRSQPWLATKVLMPSRSYIFHERKPQVDHIFPVNLEGADDAYRECVDVLWNFQPMPAEVNNYKRARHPKEFFNSPDGSKYWSSYDFIPARDSPLWDDHTAFVRDREAKMREQLILRYGLRLEKEADS